ncbi:hypothetical protein [Streptomyces mutabilis]|uniref:hypothetical protein n=1 Tax=Streptomyces mutabilis TaxID=67332 RepID=UPI0036A4E2C7
MARLQILELPEGSNDDRPPFVLVVDQYVPRRYVQGIGQTAEPVDEFTGIAEQMGARAVLVFEETVDIPANDTSGYLAPPAAKQEFVLKVGNRDMRAAITADIQKMRDANEGATTKPRRDWCCSLAYQTHGKQHIDDCKQASP